MDCSVRLAKFIILCVMCAVCVCSSGCERRNVDYIKDGTEEADESGTTVAKADEEMDTWEDFYTAEMESGNTVSIRIKVTVDSVPDTSEVMAIKRMTLAESTKKQIAETVLGDEVSFEDGVYTGSRDGIPYQMRIGQRTLSFYPADAAQIAPEDMKDALTCAFNPESVMGNRCKLSEEEAVDLAEQFLEEIGFSDRSFCEMKSLVWTANMGPEGVDFEAQTFRTVTDGYVIFFEQTLNGEQVPQFSYNTVRESMDIWMEGEERVYTWDQMRTAVCVDDHGVIAMDIYNLYEITSIEEGVSLLPISTVQDIIQKELTEHADKYIDPMWEDDLYYKSMEFGYYLIWDGAGEYGSYVPVWELYDSNWSGSKIIVNAIDGSIIPSEE